MLYVHKSSMGLRLNNCLSGQKSTALAPILLIGGNRDGDISIEIIRDSVLG